MLARAGGVARPYHNILWFLVGIGKTAEEGEHFVYPGFGGFGGVGLEGGVFEVGAGGLESVEDEPGVAMIDAAVEEGFDGFHDGDLDGVGIFEKGELEGVLAREGLAGIATGVGATTTLGLVVEVAETTVFERGTAAEFSVGLDVFAKWY